MDSLGFNVLFYDYTYGKKRTAGETIVDICGCMFLTIPSLEEKPSAKYFDSVLETSLTMINYHLRKYMEIEEMLNNVEKAKDLLFDCALKQNAFNKTFKLLGETRYVMLN